MANFYILKGGVRRWRRYRSTVRELEALSPRELGDIGISRFDIHRVARQAAKLL